MRYLFLIFLLFRFVLSYGQTKLFTLEDGLSNKDITCILQTRNGYLWVGTANGLNQYDGYTFREFNNDNGLSNGKIKCLHEDRNGLLWIGTWGGLNILDQKTGKLVHYFNKKENGKELVGSSEVTAISEQADGSVLVGTGNGVLLLFTGIHHFTIVYQMPAKEKMFRTRIQSIVHLRDSSLVLLGHDASVKKLDKHFRESPTFSISGNSVMRIDASADQNALIVLNDFGDMHFVSPATGGLLATHPYKGPPKAHPGFMTGYLSQQRYMWIGLGEGSLVVTDLVTKTTADHSADLKKFITGAATCIREDKKGILWIGTNYGLIKFCPRSRLFAHYLFSQATDYNSKNSIRGIIEDKQGDIYIGGYNGLFRINKKDNSTGHFVFNTHAKGKMNAFYPYRLLDDSAYIWLCSEIRGFYRFNKQTRNLEFPINTSVFHKGYALLHRDPHSIWIGTQYGLYSYDKEKNLLQRYSGDSKGSRVSSTEISDLAKDPSGNVWIGSYASGLFKMDAAQKIVKHYSEENTGRPMNFITAVYPENDSIVWAGSRGGGLFRINDRNGNIIVYTKKDGLSDNSVAGIEKDSSGLFWISTFNGLSKFDRSSGKFENYYDKDGLSENEFNIAAHLKASDGRLYFGGVNGVNAFYPGDLRKEEKQPPKIFLTRFVKYDGRRDKLRERSGALEDLTEIHLSYKDKFFSFYFSLDDYYDPLRNTFFYKLEGYDQDWTNIGTQNTIRFNSLPAGDYILKIKGVNSEGYATSNELAIRLAVSQAFYNSWWFYLLLLVLTASAAYLVTRYRIYQSLKIQKLRTKISSDLHDEVGSLLTRITIQAELMKQGISGDNRPEEIERIADTSRRATAAMSDVLWSIDARNDKAGNLVDRFREHAGEVLFPLEIEVAFSVKNIDAEKQVDNLVRQHLFLIFKEAIHNIAKHAKATQVNITLENTAEHFRMTVSDNGNEKKENKAGQGLRNMHMRAEALGGTVHIEDKAGFIITLTTKKI